MMNRLIVICLIVLLTASTALASVTDTVRSAVNDVITIVSSPDMKKKNNEQRRRSAIKKPLPMYSTAKKWLAEPWASTGTSAHPKSASNLLTCLQPF